MDRSPWRRRSRQGSSRWQRYFAGDPVRVSTPRVTVRRGASVRSTCCWQSCTGFPAPRCRSRGLSRTSGALRTPPRAALRQNVASVVRSGICRLPTWRSGLRCLCRRGSRAGPVGTSDPSRARRHASIVAVPDGLSSLRLKLLRKSSRRRHSGHSSPRLR